MRAPASLIRFTGRDLSAEVPILERRDAAAPKIFVARIPDGWAWANDVRDLWDTGLVPKRWDRAGIAGWLWRGVPVAARLPEAGIRSIPAGEVWRLTADGPVVERQVAKPIVPTTPDEVRTRLMDWIRRAGATDIHGADALGAAALRSVGASELFGASPMFTAWQRSRSRWARRARPARAGGDPMDVEEQRRRELDVFRDIPVNWAHSYLAALPAATREAISTVGPRSADGLMPNGREIEILSEVAWSHAAEHAAARKEAGALCPFLDDEIVRAVKGLPPRDRFGRPGSGGLLCRWGAVARSEEDGGGASEGTFGGVLASKWEAELSPTRIAEQRIFRPEAVAQAIASWREGKRGWTTGRLLVISEVTAWAAHHGVLPWRD